MKKSLITAGIIYFASLSTTHTTAQAVISSAKSISTVEPLTVGYLGSDADYHIFRIEIKTDVPAGSVFKLEDTIEGELYSKTILNKPGSQIIKVEKRENQVLDFKLLSAKKVYTKTFTSGNNEMLFQKGIALL